MGEGLQEKNNLYLVHHFKLKAIEDYFYRETPIYLYGERKYTPLNLDVYVFDVGIKDQLLRAGFKVELISGNLYRVFKKNR